jgi:hypothetical protein
VRELTIAYVRSPSGSDDPAAVLRRASELAGPWLPAAVASDLAGLRARVAPSRSDVVDQGDRAFALQAVRALRTDALPFSDDGPACAYKALRRIEDVAGIGLTPDEKSTLEEAAGWGADSPVGDDLLARLKNLRDGLIDRLQGMAGSNIGPRPHADVEDMLVRVVDALTERARETAPGVDMAVEHWLAVLENDPQGVRNAVRHYSMVLAATCQQSVSRAMEDVKLGGDTVFRTVIVDEAARSNPLDLLIPMALAERRIVLVGDHLLAMRLLRKLKNRHDNRREHLEVLRRQIEDAWRGLDPKSKPRRSTDVFDSELRRLGWAPEDKE